MQSFMRKVWNTLGRQPVAGKKRQGARLGIEMLEDRCTPTVGGTISGLVYLNSLDNGLAGATISLTGTPSSAPIIPVNLTAVTDGNGSFNFSGLPAGTYHLSTAPFAGLTGTISVGSVTSSPGVSVDADVAIGSGPNVVVQGGLDPNRVWLGFFLNTSLEADLPFSGTAGLGTPDNTPFVTDPIPDQTLSSTATSKVINLATHFSDPIFSDSSVTMNVTANGVANQHINLTLSDTTTPAAVANFFDYVNAGAYDNNIFFRNTNNAITDASNTAPIVITSVGHGLITGNNITISDVKGNTAANGARTVTVIDADTFSLNGTTGNGTYTGGGTWTKDIAIIQAGGLLVNDGTGPALNTTSFPTIPDEISALNLKGTLATANTGAANSASEQFFFNTADNSNLDHPPGSGTQGYTVFAKVSDDASQAVLDGLVAAPTTNSDLSGTTFATGITGFLLSDVPLTTGSATDFPTTAADYLVINSITINKRDEFLTYNIVSNSNPTLVTATILNEHLTITIGTGTGTAEIVVQAVDRFGATVNAAAFTVTVS